jgi:RNA polymerase sigma-70 factor (ECF subfamily)
MATRRELGEFLAGAERRAYKQALFALRDEDNALDVVQDAMLKLSEHYSDRPAPELPLLFTRILQNSIHDFFRRQKVRSTWVSLFSAFTGSQDNDEDPLETLEAMHGTQAAERVTEQGESGQIVAILAKEQDRLPGRPRKAYLVSSREQKDVAETAAAMGCSEGSVKTHCSRATHALARALQARGITL